MKISSQPLRPSPYTAYRDPDTGQWRIAKQGRDEGVNSSVNSVQDNGKSP